MRESPSFKLIELIEKRGASVDYHDPFIARIPRTRAHPELSGRRSQALSADAVAAYDAVLISTDHDAIDWGGLVAAAKLVIDTRNVCERQGVGAPHVVKA
jgi:UDP-N-acetyl-D-glucosamine dehydrogenase